MQQKILKVGEKVMSIVKKQTTKNKNLLATICKGISFIYKL